MAILSMTQVPVQGEASELAWEAEDSLAGAGNGKAIIVPDGVNQLAVTLAITSGSAKVQTTTDKINAVEQEKATVTWVDWDAGEVSATRADVCAPVTALRLVQTTAGATALKVRAQ
jgi:hypothetical protein